MMRRCDGSAGVRCLRSGCTVPRRCLPPIVAEIAIEQARGVVDALPSRVGRALARAAADVTWPSAVLAAGVVALAIAVVA